ncbi:MAG: hypothetical protein Salg2KO_06130 [Salibacteraceae bacterium]
MNNILLKMGLAIIIALLNFSDFNALRAQNMMPLPSHSNVYSGSARGFWFVAPTTFKITGLRVASQAGSGNQAIQLVKILDPMPIAFTNQSSNFTTLFYTNTGANGQILPVNVLINAGDTIGVLGTAGTSNSYGNGAYNSNIFGTTVPIQRFGYQGNINGGQTTQIWGVGYNTSGSISRVEVYYDLATISEFPYCEDFEEDDGSWEVSGILPSWEYGEPNNSTISSANSGTGAWVTDLDGTYNNDELSYLSSPLIDLTSLVDPMLKYWTIYDLENGDDGVQVEISGDSGTTYSVLGSSSSSNWYNSSSVAALSSNGNGNGWTGLNGTWHSVEHSLLANTNDTAVFIRMLMAADGTTAGEGYGLDDIIIAESNDISLVSLNHPDSICGNSTTSINATICNNSIEDKHGFSINLDTNGVTTTYNYPDTLGICDCQTVELLEFNTSQGGVWQLDAVINNSGDVNSSNDSLSSVITTFATPSATISGSGNFCEGEETELTFVLGGTGPWNMIYTNGTNSQYVGGITNDTLYEMVSVGGSYYVLFLSDSTGCPADTSNFNGLATIEFHPAPNVDLGSDTSVCEGFELDAGAGFTQYDWSQGGNGQTFPATATGQLAVTVTDTIGCMGSDTINLTVLDNPTITIDDTVLCDGTTFIFNAGGGSASYVWHDGSTGQVFPVSSVQTVSVTVTGFNGCVAEKSASITAVVSNPNPSLSSTSGPAPVTLDAGGGYSSYLWNTNETTQTIQAFSAGNYTCTVTDLNGCTGDGSVEADIWANGVSELANDNSFVVAPNPASNAVTITLIGEDALTADEIEITDVAGRLVESFSNVKTPLVVNTAEYPMGTYFIRVRFANTTENHPLIINR